MKKAIITALLLFPLLTVLAHNHDKPNICFESTGNGRLAWGGKCQTGEDWTAGYYVHQRGCQWTYINRPHLRDALRNKGSESCVKSENTDTATGVTTVSFRDSKPKSNQSSNTSGETSSSSSSRIPTPAPSSLVRHVQRPGTTWQCFRREQDDGLHTACGYHEPNHVVPGEQVWTRA